MRIFEQPWGIERVPIQSRGGSNTCFKIGPMNACVYDDWQQRDRGFSEEEIIAAVNLMAAAPALLAEAKALLRDASYADGYGTVLTQDCEALEAAIAKAEGKGGAPAIT